jgi:hypothetical protein
VTLNRSGEDEIGNGLRISFTLVEVLKFAVLLGPLFAASTFAVSLRQDVRTNAVRMTAIQTEMAELRQGIARFDRAHLLYCAGLKADTVGGRPPDADC